jgi:uncharacterized membrane protein YecN with MAPEG domain
MILPTTLCFAAAAALVSFWLTMRCGKVRAGAKDPVGDGGNEALTRRMRAQANFVEQTPLTVILVGLIELAGKGGQWLAPAAAVFILGRIAHAFGMDGNFKPGRGIGMLTALLLQLALIVVAVLIVLGKL